MLLWVSLSVIPSQGNPELDFVTKNGDSFVIVPLCAVV